jgi:hypothetical protein
MAKGQTVESLLRYTNIPALIYLLRERKVTLLDPAFWDDKNDSHYLSLYQQKKSLKSVLALCFTQVSETYHHWRVFADGSSGVCIRFSRPKLMNALKKQSGLRAKPVRYLTISDIRQMKLKVEELPFLKRYPYGDEREFRVIYESKTEKRDSLDIAIPLNCIQRVTLSPWIPLALTEHLKSTLRGIDGCEALKVFRSTLISNEQWKDFAEDARP